MSAVVSTLTIQNLQIAAALLMGYDYFLSSRLKAKADAAASAYMQAQHDLSAKQLSLTRPDANQIRALLATLALFLATAVTVMLVGWAMFRAQRSPWIIAVTSVMALFFIAGTLQGIARFLSIFVGPRAAPALFLPLAKFLLFSSKGVIAALGFLFLIASFVLRYVNELS